MPESGSESPKARHFRRFDPKEYHEAKRSERKQKAELSRKKTERKQALSALSQDKPEIADRTDLENLAGLNNQPEISREYTPPPSVKIESAGRSVIGKNEGGIKTPQPEQRTEKTLDEKVQERLVALKKDSTLTTKKDKYRITKVEEFQLRDGNTIKRYWVNLGDREHWFSEQNVRGILRDNIKNEQETSKKAAREAATTEKEQRSSSLDKRINSYRAALISGTAAGFEISRGKQVLTYAGYDETYSNPYKFKDENGNTQYISKSEVDKLLRAKFRKEDKATLEELQVEPKWKERLAAAGVVAEKVGEAIKSGAEKTPATKVLYNFGLRFLDKFRIGDKDKVPYFIGMATGFGSNVALTVFVPWLSFGPGRMLRSAAYSGILLGTSKGVNLLRSFSIREIGKKLGTFGNEFTKDAINTMNKASALEAEGKQEESMNLRNEWSREVFLKSGYTERSDYWTWTQDIARAALIAKLEQQMIKYNRLNRGVKSFAAGLSAGTITATAGFGVESLLEKLFKGDIHIPFVGGGAEHHEVHSPGAQLSETPHPTPPVEGPGHIQPEIPPIEPPHEAVTNISDILSNPDLNHAVQIHSGDTAGQLFVDHGYDVSWGPHDADLFGTHIYANYDMLKEMHDNVATAGIPVEVFPSQAELADLIRAAEFGDPVAMQRLTEALHWVPAGGHINVLTPEGIIEAKKALGLT